MSHFGIPGPGGSLGECAICGKDFLLEILTGAKVKTFQVSDVTQTLYAHAKCIEPFKDGPLDCELLPATSPLRQAYERTTPKPPIT
jgi:hypothetical protein